MMTWQQRLVLIVCGAAMKMFAAADSVAGQIGMINVCSSFDKQPDI